MEVDVPLRLGRAGVRGRAKLADQPHLLERGGKLGAREPPLDVIQLIERRLHGRSLASGLEVRPQPGPEVAGLPDVEHAALCVAKEVDAGLGRRALDEVPLAVDPPGPRRRQLFELGQGRGPALERKVDQAQEHLGSCLSVGKSAMARLDRDAEEVRERPEARPVDPTAEQVPGERHRVDHGRRDSLPADALELAIDETDVEAGVVRDEHGVAGERHELRERLTHPRRRAQFCV